MSLPPPPCVDPPIWLYTQSGVCSPNHDHLFPPKKTTPYFPATTHLVLIIFLPRHPHRSGHSHPIRQVVDKQANQQDVNPLHHATKSPHSLLIQKVPRCVFLYDLQLLMDVLPVLVI